MRLKFKYKKQFHWLIKISLLISIICLLFNQIQRNDLFNQRFPSIQQPIFLCLTLLLVGANIGIELLKWKYVLQLSAILPQKNRPVKSFFAGFLTGFLTPNFIGNFIGRMYYFERKERPTIIILTLFSNASQFLASIFFGVAGVLWLGFPDFFKFDQHAGLYLFSSASVLLLLIAYFTLERIPALQKNRTVRRIRIVTQYHFYFRGKLLFMSFLRHFIFTLQYFLLLKAFGLDIPYAWIGLIWQVFFWSTIIPSFWFGKIGIRESFALLILAPICHEPMTIIVASLSLFVINQVLPSLVGIPFLTWKK